MTSAPRVLLVSVCRRHENDFYDIWAQQTRSRFRPFALRRAHFGLRFLKQNVPEVEILEYPTWSEYERALTRGWDIVGFSFYLSETPTILRMVERARQFGVRELWAGNYGALTGGMDRVFDRLHLGPGEEVLAGLFGRRVERWRHPPIVYVLRLGPFGLRYALYGVLFTSRGCSSRCDFCQTAAFCPRPEQLPLEAIDDVLRYYRSIGCRHVMILDENFGMFLDHSDRVFELLDRYHMYAAVTLRADRLLTRLDQWVAQGLDAAILGIESVSQSSLDAVGKRETRETILEAVIRLHEHDCYALGSYMIGFPAETEQSIRRDIEELTRYRVDSPHITVVTPLPQTPLWKEIERCYGIDDHDYSHYDIQHLVWNHPHLTPAQMDRLFWWAVRRVNSPALYLESAARLMRRYVAQEGVYHGLRTIFTAPGPAGRYDELNPRQVLP